LLLFISAKASAATFTDNQTVDKHKNWTITFTQEILESSIHEGIQVLDSNNNSVSGITTNLGQDNKTVIVNAPTEGYIEGSTYKLVINTNVKSIKNIQLKKSIEVNFKIIIEQSSIVMVPGLENTQITAISNWASVSSVQQFSYKNEGLAYAYVIDSSLKITMPNKQLNIEMKYPLLGDIISDDDGNLYIVWGKKNETNNASIETVFISKYSSQGQHIKTTGFVGKSSPWGNSDIAKTKVAFQSGNCVSIIANGILVNYHAKRRYDGHQSDNAIAVLISDMSPYQLPNDTYSGHSFNQSLIYCNKTSDFLFASQGDAYIRGFRINDSSGKYGDEKENIFHFYLESNANYNMWIVNKTFAQLGGLAETSKGVALVGASAK